MNRIQTGLFSILLAINVSGAKTWITTPTGTDGGAGTVASPVTLAKALTSLAPGDTIYLRAGTYAFNNQITIDTMNNGMMPQMKNLFAYPGEKPVLDFSSEPYGTGSNLRGLQINGNYWHVEGLEVTGSADNGIYLAGNYNVIEACLIHKNRDSGLQIGRAVADAPNNTWPSHNLILNCESYDNYDAPPGSGENADGFACKLTAGDGNVFRGCISHNNIDDGWDLYTKSATGAIGSVVIDQCVSYHNGTLTDGTVNPNGDRNGFKLGGESIPVAHTVTRFHRVPIGFGKQAYQRGRGSGWNASLRRDNLLSSSAGSRRGGIGRSGIHPDLARFQTGFREAFRVS